MTEQPDFGTQGQDNGTGSAESQPPYASYLERFPEPVRPIAESAFKEWDAGVTQRFQTYSQQLQEFAPYKPLIDEWEPQALQEALQLSLAMQTDPRAFYDMMGQSYGFNTPVEETDYGQGDEGQQQYQDPRVDELQTAMNALLEMQTANQQREQEEQEEAEVIEALQQLEQQHGQFDWEFVLTQAAAGKPLDEAVKHYQSIVNQAASQQNAAGGQAPVVMGAGGSLPTQQTKPSDWSANERKDFVASLLQQQQNQQG